MQQQERTERLQQRYQSRSPDWVLLSLNGRHGREQTNADVCPGERKQPVQQHLQYNDLLEQEGRVDRALGEEELLPAVQPALGALHARHEQHEFAWGDQLGQADLEDERLPQAHGGLRKLPVQHLDLQPAGIALEQNSGESDPAAGLERRLLHQVSLQE